MKALRFAGRILASATSRRESVDGREMLVAPIVVLTRTVINCATCRVPEFMVPEEFAKEPEKWNGQPIVFDHPKKTEGDQIRYLSAHDDDAKGFHIGELHAARRQDEKLCGEVWIDIKNAEERGASEVITRIENGDPIEISAGFYDDVRIATGEYRGKPYGGIGYNFRPDHVAILPSTEVGACSWDDGCGIRVAAGMPSDSMGAGIAQSELADICEKKKTTWRSGKPITEGQRRAACAALTPSTRKSQEAADTKKPKGASAAPCSCHEQKNVAAHKCGECRITAAMERALITALKEIEEDIMDRDKLIAKLAKQLSGGNDARIKALTESLTALSDEGLTAIDEAETDRATAAEKAKADEAAKVAAEKPKPTPPSEPKPDPSQPKVEISPEMKWLTGKLEQMKKGYVEQIKAATDVYSDDDLSTMPFDLLEKTAKVVLKDAASKDLDFSQQGGPRGGVKDESGDPLDTSKFDERVKALRQGKKNAA